MVNDYFLIAVLSGEFIHVVVLIVCPRHSLCFSALHEQGHKHIAEQGLEFFWDPPVYCPNHKLVH